MNSSEIPSNRHERNWNIEDHHGTQYYLLLKQLPPELARKHGVKIENEAMNEDEATEYLERIVSDRREITTVSVISDERTRELCEGKEKAIFYELETSVYSNPENIGTGNTAKVKRYEIAAHDEVQPVAVKYLITPDENTVSAAGEHNIIKEVERIQEIEKLEENAQLTRFKVPHPYFHHRNEEIQCYGMQLIDGITLEEGTQKNADIEPERMEKIRAALADISREEIEKEVDIFFERMHAEYLHRDIKSANIMIDSNGVFYLIDFGQSTPTSELSARAVENLEESKKHEVEGVKAAINNFLKNLSRTE